MDEPTDERLVLERALMARGAERVADRRDVPSAPGGDDGTTRAQQRMWLLDQLAASPATHHVVVAFRLEGPVDPGALQRAYGVVTARHANLSRPFVEGPAGLTRAAPAELAPLEVRDAVDADEDLRLHREAPFDLAAGSLVRALLLATGLDRWELQIGAHHAAMDGSAMMVLLEELAVAYAADLTGAAPSLPPAPAAHAAVVAERKREASGELGAAVDRGRHRLAGAPWRVHLPFGPGDEAAAAACACRHRLAPEAFARFSNSCRRAGVTPATGLIAGLAGVLAATGRQAELVLGVPTAGRADPEVERLVDVLVDTLVVRVAADSGEHPAALLTRCHDALLAAYEDRAAPIDALVRPMRPHGAADEAAVNVLVTWQEMVSGGWSLPGVTTTWHPTPPLGAKVDLELMAGIQGGTLVLELVHDPRRFATADVERLAVRLERLLVDLGADLPLAAVVAGDEPLAVLVGPPAHGDPFTVVDQFRRVAEQAPTAVALIDGERSVTYEQLAAAVARLSGELRQRWTGPEPIVSLELDRSAEAIAGLLACLHAGAVCLPLPPSVPRERLAWALDDARPAVRLVAPGTVGDARLLAVDLDLADCARARLDPCRAGLGNAAYAMYTSGTTGRPKAVVTEHGPLANRLAWMQDLLDLRPGEHVLHKTPLSFDPCFWEMLWPLTVGAAVVVAAAGEHARPRRLAEHIARHGVRVAHFVPTMLAAFLADLDPAAPVSLPDVVCSGEALAPGIAHAARRRLGARVLNLYGPTEAAIDVSGHHVGERDRYAVPIGRAGRGARLYVLDERLEQLPVGAVGELFIGGIAPARGYLRRPALTAERFLPDPTTSGQRMYRTGDLVRLGPDGLDYLGREDRQVKVNGVRLELAEVEAALGEHPDVADAAVVASGAPPVLHAWFVPARGSGVDVAQLRQHLRTRLAGAAMPATLTRVDALPVTSSGKLNRDRLPAPAGREPGDRVAPGSAEEQAVAEAVARILGTADVSMDDNYFDLGGDSMRTIELVGRLRAAGWATDVGQVAGALTLVELAAGLQVCEAADSPTRAAFSLLADLSPRPGQRAPNANGNAVR